MTQILKNLKAYWYLSGLRWKKIVSFKASLVILSLSMLVNNILFFLFWVLLLINFGNINGYTVVDFLLINGFMAITYAPWVWLYGNVQRLGEYLRDDSFLELQLFPVSPLVVLLNKSGSASLVGDFVQGIIFIGIYSYFNPMALVWILPAIIIVCVGCFGLMLAVASLSFYFPNLTSAGDVLFNFLFGSVQYPANSFQGLSKTLLLGSGIWFVYFVPIETVRNGALSWDFALATMVAIVLATLGLQIWKYGLRRVESGGGMGIVNVD
jgi:ABC-2 type transport system permease protein